MELESSIISILFPPLLPQTMAAFDFTVATVMISGSRELIGRFGVPVAPDRCALVVSLMTSFSKMPLFTTIETTLFPWPGDDLGSCVLCPLCHYLRSIELPLLYCQTFWITMQLVCQLHHFSHKQFHWIRLARYCCDLALAVHSHQ